MTSMRNKFIAGIMAVMVVASFGVLAGCGGGSSAGAFKDGTYSAEGEGGKGGNVPVTVTVAGGKITEIKIGENSETPAMIKKAEETVIPAIIKEQKADVDGAATATLSSNAIKDGVKKALEQAK